VRLLKQAWLNDIAGNKLHRVSDEWPVVLGRLIQWGVALAQRMEKPSTYSVAGSDPLDDLVDALVDELAVPRMSFSLSSNGMVKDAVRRMLARVERSLLEVLTQRAVMDRGNWAALLAKYVAVDRLNHDGTTCPCLGITAIKAETGELGYAWNRVPPGVCAQLDGDDARRAGDAQVGIAIQHLMASSSIPGIYPAVEIRRAYWWDGALAANTPIAPAIDILLHNLPAQTEIVVVLMTPYGGGAIGAGGGTSSPPTVLDALQRFLDWMMLASLRKELGRLGPEQRAWVRIVAPRDLMGVVQIIDYGEEDVRRLIAIGREDAERVWGRLSMP
jgi:hypothetical protein